MRPARLLACNTPGVLTETTADAEHRKTFVDLDRHGQLLAPGRR